MHTLCCKIVPADTTSELLLSMQGRQAREKARVGFMLVLRWPFPGITFAYTQGRQLDAQSYEFVRGRFIVASMLFAAEAVGLPGAVCQAAQPRLRSASLSSKRCWQPCP